jgi:peptidyl-dipeptidase A
MGAIRCGEIILVLAIAVCAWPLTAASPSKTDRARQFIARHEAKIKPLEISAGLAWWNANVTGSDADYQKKEDAQNRIDESLADPVAFQELKNLREAVTGKKIDDPLVARSIEILHLQYLEKQVNPELLKKISALANEIDKKFNNYRARVDGRQLSDSEVRAVLKTSTNSDRRRDTWEASKGVGKLVEKELIELVKLRNESARNLGFANFHDLYLFLNEQDGPGIIKLFDELDQLTRGPFLSAKADIDERLAKMYGVASANLMPWHYQDPFFQESPSVFAVSLDKPFEKADIPDLCRKFYASIGLPIEDVLARSDLYEKKGKCPHAFCTDIDRAGDVRVLANIVPNEMWMGTMLHELGHSVYSSKNIPPTLPYILRGESHILTTEGVAMQFERFSKQRAFLEAMGLSVENPEAFDEAAAKIQRNQLLIFSRWCQVMLRFERGMYSNPDQDLNKLWWDMVEKYQGLKRPTGRNAPDYGSKIHIVSTPVYYHNYMMGQLFASQVHHALCREVFGGADPAKVLYNGNKKAGEFMTKKVFAPGKTLSWNQLTKFATGSELNAKAFAEDFKGG